MRLLVFQHLAVEHPGVLRRFLAADGIAWEAVRLDQGQPIPPLEGYDQLWVMGGPMDVWDVDEHPWLAPEKAAIRHWVRDLRAPVPGRLPGPPAAGRRARRHLRPAAPARGRHPRGRADRRRSGRPPVRRPARPPALPAMALGQGRPAARGCGRAGPLRCLRLPGLPPRPPCLRPAIPCRARARDHPRPGVTSPPTRPRSPPSRAKVRWPASTPPLPR